MSFGKLLCDIVGFKSSKQIQPIIQLFKISTNCKMENIEAIHYTHTYIAIQTMEAKMD